MPPQRGIQATNIYIFSLYCSYYFFLQVWEGRKEITQDNENVISSLNDAGDGDVAMGDDGVAAVVMSGREW